MDNTEFEARNNIQKIQTEQEILEKRKQDTNPKGEGDAKRRKTGDIREMLRRTEVPATPGKNIQQEEEKAEMHEIQDTIGKQKKKQQEDADPEQRTKEDVRRVVQGPEETVKLVDWQEMFTQHIAETRRKERDRLAKKQLAEKKEESWSLLRECIKFLKEN